MGAANCPFLCNNFFIIWEQKREKKQNNRAIIADGLSGCVMCNLYAFFVVSLERVFNKRSSYWWSEIRCDITVMLIQCIFGGGASYINCAVYHIEYDYSDVIMSSMASQIISLTIVCTTVYSDADQRKHQSSTSLAFGRNSPVTGEFPAQRTSNAENVSIRWRHRVEFYIVIFERESQQPTMPQCRGML